MLKESADHYDVVIVGSGVAGALVAYKLVKAGKKVCILEAGGFAADRAGRYEMIDNFIGSPSKATDAPFCGDNVLASQPNPRKSPDGINAEAAEGVNYYVYPPPEKYKGDKFVSYYGRLVGGSMWHWQGIYVRMIPSDFEMKKRFGRGEDWPISYKDIERYYVEAENEMGVSGDPPDRRLYKDLGGPAKGYPMSGLVPSYMDKEVSYKIGGNIPGRPKQRAVVLNTSLPGVAGFRPENIELHVTTVPHAILSQDDKKTGRQACDGRSSCIPLCPTGARYDAMIHLNKALIRDGSTGGFAKLYSQAIAVKLDIEDAKDDKTGKTGKKVRGVHYRRWKWDEGKDPARRVRDGADGFVSADLVVLAANAIENPMIMLRSGPENFSPKLGKYLMDHPIKQSYALAPMDLYPFRGPQTTSQIEDFRDGAFRRAYAAFKTSIKNDGWMSNVTSAPRGNVILPVDQPGYDPTPAGDWWPGTILDYVHNRKYAGKRLQTALRQSLRHITLNSACEQLPDENNYVALAFKDDNPSLEPVLDDLEIQRPRINYMVDDPYVRNCFKKIIELHAAVFNAMGIKQEHQKLQPPEPPDKRLTFGGSGHIMGTTRMGSNRDSSVVDKDCKCHDFLNLFVVGSSIFPTGSTANPTATLAALALRTADHIAKLRINT